MIMYRLMSSLCLLWGNFAYSQGQDKAIEYSGGQQQLEKIIFKYLSGHKGLFDHGMYADSIRKSNKYFVAVFKVEKNGFIGEDILISSCNDSTNIPVIAGAIKETNGKWINRTGETRWVALPIYFIHKMENVPDEVVPQLKSEMYRGRSKVDVITLHRIEVIMGPSVASYGKFLIPDTIRTELSYSGKAIQPSHS